MKKFNLEIATPDGMRFSGEAESVLVRTADGDVEIMSGHTDLLASITTGRVRIKADGENRFASASGGFLSVTKDGVKLVTTTFEFAEDIDIRRAEEAKERAEQLLKSASDKSEIAYLEAKLARALVRLRVANM